MHWFHPSPSFFFKLELLYTIRAINAEKSEFNEDQATCCQISIRKREYGKEEDQEWLILCSAEVSSNMGSQSIDNRDKLQPELLTVFIAKPEVVLFFFFLAVCSGQEGCGGGGGCRLPAPSREPSWLPISLKIPSLEGGALLPNNHSNNTPWHL